MLIEAAIRRAQHRTPANAPRNTQTRTDRVLGQRALKMLRSEAGVHCEVLTHPERFLRERGCDARPDHLFMREREPRTCVRSNAEQRVVVLRERVAAKVIRV